MSLFLLAVHFLQETTIEQEVAKLRSNTVELREAARGRLERLGKEAIPALEKAAAGVDAELTQVIKEIVSAIRSAQAWESFRKIENKLSKAKSIRVVINGSGMSSTGLGNIRKGTAHIKEGNKVRIVIRGGATTNVMTKIICDGITLSMPLGADGPDKRTPPKNLTALFAAALVRYGLDASFFPVRQVTLEGGQAGGDVDPDLVWKISDLREGVDEDGLKSLEYKIKPIDTGLPLQARLLYDSKMFLPRKHIISFEGRGVRWTQVESYEELTIDGDVPDELFRFTEEETAQLDLKVGVAKAVVAVLGGALEKYRQDTGGYPDTKVGLTALLRPKDGAHNWKGPYIASPAVPVDPWGNTFFYRAPGVDGKRLFDLVSSGPDGKFGTGDDVCFGKPSHE